MGVSRKKMKSGGKRRVRKFPKRSKLQLSNGICLGFRSGLEMTNAVLLDNLGQDVMFEAIKIPFSVPKTDRKYSPDFVLSNGIIIETKGKLEPKDRAKHVLIQQQHPDLDIRFVFQRPHDKINKGSPTSYAKWCEKNGFKWASMTIPEVWINEDGPSVSPWEALGVSKPDVSS